MASTAPRNHWWHVPLYVDVRGLTTRRMHAPNGVTFEIDFDFVDHRLVVRTSDGAVESFALADGLSVAEFDEKVHATLAGLGIDVAITEKPFGVPMTTPYPEDREHASYDRRRGRAVLAHPRLDRRRLRGVLRLVLRQDEPGSSLLALLRSRRHAFRRRVARPRSTVPTP